MWAIKCLSLLAMLLVPLFVHGQHVQGPCYVVDGKTYAFVSSTNELGIEKKLSEHIAQNLPMILYDTPVRDKDLLRKVPIAYSFQCARAVPLAYSRRNSMQLMPHKDS